MSVLVPAAARLIVRGGLPRTPLALFAAVCSGQDVQNIRLLTAADKNMAAAHAATTHLPTQS
jgi:hypothetical protein